MAVTDAAIKLAGAFVGGGLALGRRRDRRRYR